MLWDFEPSVMKLSPYYKIRPTPPDTVVEYPLKLKKDEAHLVPTTDNETPQVNPIPFSENTTAEINEPECKGKRGRPRKQPSEASPQPKRGRGPRKHPSEATPEPKRGRGHPRKAGIADTPLPKRQKLNASGAHSSSVLIDPQLQHFNQLVDDCLHGNSPRSVLQQLALQSVVEM